MANVLHLNADEHFECTGYLEGDISKVTCHTCLRKAVELGRAALDRQIQNGDISSISEACSLPDQRHLIEAALRNCLSLALSERRRVGASGGWDHIVRFCRSAGIEPSILRAVPGADEQAPPPAVPAGLVVCDDPRRGPAPTSAEQAAVNAMWELMSSHWAGPRDPTTSGAPPQPLAERKDLDQLASALAEPAADAPAKARKGLQELAAELLREKFGRSFSAETQVALEAIDLVLVRLANVLANALRSAAADADGYGDGSIGGGHLRQIADALMGVRRG